MEFSNRAFPWKIQGRGFVETPVPNSKEMNNENK